VVDDALRRGWDGGFGKEVWCEGGKDMREGKVWGDMEEEEEEEDDRKREEMEEGMEGRRKTRTR